MYVRSRETRCLTTTGSLRTTAPWAAQRVQAKREQLERRSDRVRRRAEENQRPIWIATKERKIALVHVARVKVGSPVHVQQWSEQREAEPIIRDSLYANRSIWAARQ